ncbi:hypothetical protein QJS04_geneDACA014243 [Acorus gramineus]|uniref:Uncharacterized protein n=1 Tax=Acorus gramineus TaxID=55184 RepID=A0AAV9BV19_ACOGR|nr:hypothetical protein QJS04_geneDACA014243 [Acorus gramineus]
MVKKSDVPLMFSFNGRIIRSEGSSFYEGGTMKTTIINKISYVDLLQMMYHLTGTDPSLYKLSMSAVHPTHDGKCLGAPLEDDMGVKVMIMMYPKHAHIIQIWLEKEEIIQRGRGAMNYDAEDSYPSIVREPYQPSSSSFVPCTEENMIEATPTNAYGSVNIPHL